MRPFIPVVTCTRTGHGEYEHCVFTDADDLLSSQAATCHLGLQGIDAHTCTHGRDTFAWRSQASHQITSHSRKRLYTVISRRLCSDAALSCSSGSQCCSVSVLQPNVICENMVPRLHSFQPPPHGRGCRFVRRLSVFCVFVVSSGGFDKKPNGLQTRKRKHHFKSFVLF